MCDVWRPFSDLTTTFLCGFILRRFRSWLNDSHPKCAYLLVIPMPTIADYEPRINLFHNSVSIILLSFAFGRLSPFFPFILVAVEFFLFASFKSHSVFCRSFYRLIPFLVHSLVFLFSTIAVIVDFLRTLFLWPFVTLRIQHSTANDEHWMALDILSSKSSLKQFQEFQVVFIQHINEASMHIHPHTKCVSSCRHITSQCTFSTFGTIVMIVLNFSPNFLLVFPSLHCSGWLLLMLLLRNEKSEKIEKQNMRDGKMKKRQNY